MPIARQSAGIIRALIGGASAMLITATSHAQATSAAATAWQPFIGCWRATVQVAPTDVALSDEASEADRVLARRAFAMLDSARSRELGAKAPVVCVVPSGTANADVVTVDSDRVLSRFTVDATGGQHSI